jgi:hypothetical protein
MESVRVRKEEEGVSARDTGLNTDGIGSREIGIGRS